MPSGDSYTPPRLARRWLVKPEKVVAFIRGGHLKAINVASSTSGRPRWVITPEAVAAFEAARSAVSAEPVPRTRRRKAATTIEFF